MRRAAARSAVLRVSSPAAADIATAGTAVAAIATARLARCIAPHAQAVAKRPRYLFSRAKTGLSIVVTATSRKALAAVTTIAARAGSPGDRNFSASWRFF